MSTGDERDIFETENRDDLMPSLNNLKRSRSAFIGHLTRIINRINESLCITTTNIKTIKCLEEQLYQTLERLKQTNEKYINLTFDHEDIEQSNEIYFENHSRVIEISEAIQSFILTQQEKVNNEQQIYYRSVIESKHSASNSYKSKSSSNRTSQSSRSRSSQESTRQKIAKAELVANQAREKFDRRKTLLERQKAIELDIEKEKLYEAQNKLQLAQLTDQNSYDIEQNQSAAYINNDNTIENKTDVTFNDIYLKATPKIAPENTVSDLNDKTSSFNLISFDQPIFQSSENKINSTYVIKNTSKELEFENQSTSSASHSSSLQEQDDSFIEKQSKSSIADISSLKEPVDLFIDTLVEGKETQLPPSSQADFTVLFALQQELEGRNLPPIMPLSFDGNASDWPEFIENFKVLVHSKSTFNDTIRMQRLHSVLIGDAKRSIDAIGRNGIFYATALKCLKREFGNPSLVTHLKLKALFDKPQIKPNDRVALKLYHQNLKCTVTWLVSMGYVSTLSSIENLTKAVQRLPHFLRQTFYRHSRDILDSEVISLLEFENWLNKRTKEFYNPIANIIASQEPFRQKDSKSINNFKYESKTLKCYCCSDDHKLTKCETFLSKTLEAKNDFVKEHKLCWNCLSKGHMIKECKSQYRCRTNNCNQRHHTLLHFDKNEKSIQVSNIKTSLLNKTFLQILPITISNGSNHIQTNALLDSGSNATLISREIARKLKIKGNQQIKLKIGNALLNPTNFESSLVNFEISSKCHPQKVQISNAFIVPTLDVKTENFNLNTIKQHYSHLSDIDLPKLNSGEVTVLIGTDHPYPHLQNDYRFKNHDLPCAVKTPLGWVLIGGKSKTMSVQSNLLESFDLERFWSVESYGTLKKLDEVMMTKDEKKALSTLENTIQFTNGHYEVGMLWKHQDKQLVNNKQVALERLKSLERKLNRYDDIRIKYSQTISDYVKLGHAQKLTKQEALSFTNNINYIPHHYVINPKQGNKFRIVFDASAKFKGKSLNDNLLKGPDLLNNLVTVLLRFRTGKYAVSADIEKMFNQIRVTPKDRDSLRILYRENVSDEVE